MSSLPTGPATSGSCSTWWSARSASSTSDTIERRPTCPPYHPGGSSGSGPDSPTRPHRPSDSIQLPDAASIADSRTVQGGEGAAGSAKFEKDYISSLLKKNDGNISHAAREADIDRKYFRKLMKKYGISAHD